MPSFFCPYCGKETTHLNVQDAALAAHVTRTTIYKWIEGRLVHCLRRPSGRKFVCSRSLLVPDAFHGVPAPEMLPVRTMQLRRG